MKTSRKILFAVLILGALFLAGCGRSDMTLTVNEDGSFKAVVNYGIIKAGVANDEAMEQAKSLITESLDEAGVAYAETEDDEKVTITVERDFANLEELTSPTAWHGIGFVPAFTDSEGGGIWARYEDGSLRLSGVLDAAAYGAEDIVSGSDSFGGSVTVVLPSEAKDFSGGEKTDAGYVWSGGGGDTVELDVTSAPIFSEIAGSNDGAPGAKDSKDDKSGKDGDEKSALPWIGVLIGAIAAAAVIFVIVKKNGAHIPRQPKEEVPEAEPENKPEDETTSEAAPSDGEQQ